MAKKTYSESQKKRTMRYLEKKERIVLYVSPEEKTFYREEADKQKMEMKSFLLRSADYIINNNIDLKNNISVNKKTTP